VTAAFFPCCVRLPDGTLARVERDDAGRWWCVANMRGIRTVRFELTPQLWSTIVVLARREDGSAAVAEFDGDDSASIGESARGGPGPSAR
jgi:hypothetical protein